MMSTTAAPVAKMPARKPSGSRRAKKLVRLDGRSVEFRRVAALVSMWRGAITKAGGEISPLRLERMRQAAQSLTLAETARGKYLRNGTGKLSDVVAAERLAAGLVSRLGLPREEETAPKPEAAQPSARGRLSRLTDAELDAYESLMAEAEANEGRP